MFTYLPTNTNKCSKKVLLIGHSICYSNSKEFRTCVFAGGTYMSRKERIKIIIAWLKKADDKQLERLQCFIQAFLRAGES